MLLHSHNFDHSQVIQFQSLFQSRRLWVNEGSKQRQVNYTLFQTSTGGKSDDVRPGTPIILSNEHDCFSIEQGIVRNWNLSLLSLHKIVAPSQSKLWLLSSAATCSANTENSKATFYHNLCKACRASLCASVPHKTLKRFPSRYVHLPSQKYMPSPFGSRLHTLCDV